MGARSRWAFALLLPVLGVVLLVVRTSWLAYVHTLSESELHQQVFDNSTAVVAALWALTIGLAASIAWWAAGRLVARDRAGPSDRVV